MTQGKTGKWFCGIKNVYETPYLEKLHAVLIQGKIWT